jgi:hypothetical protein
MRSKRDARETRMFEARNRRFARPSPAALALAMLAIAAAGFAGGCAPAALRSARTNIQSGHYLQARQDLLKLRARQSELSADQRREVNDDLCMTEFMIGRPTLSLREQRDTCARAAAEPGSKSAEYLARINQEIATADVAAVEHALKEGDLAGAETAAEDYAATPGADPKILAQWADRMWSMVDARQPSPPRAKRHHKEIARAIAALRKENREIRSMSEAEFHDWIVKTATVSGQPIAVEPRFHAGILRLTVPADALQVAALNLDRFAKINDAAIARCNCDAHTNVGLGPGAFPAYIARLDPQERRSEVVILLSGRSIGPKISMR